MMQNDPPKTKVIATVRETARMVGLSPSRFYQLMNAGVFPMPVYDIRSRRPCFTQEQQEQCLEVRRRNCGINGRPVLFYSGRSTTTAPPKSKRPRRDEAAQPHADILDGLRSLGLATATGPAVAEAVRTLFPSGIASADKGEVIRSVFLHLRRQDSSDSAGR